jgi:hypothetical protein
VFDLEDEGTNIVKNVRKYTSNNTVSHVGRLKFYSGVNPSGFGRTLRFHHTSPAVQPENGEYTQKELFFFFTMYFTDSSTKV